MESENLSSKMMGIFPTENVMQVIGNQNPLLQLLPVMLNFKFSDFDVIFFKSQIPLITAWICSSKVHLNDLNKIILHTKRRTQLI